jgi:hypothetical protein
MQSAKPQVTRRGDVRTRPDHLGIKPEESLCPTTPPANGALKLKLVGLKENLLMCTHMPRDLLAV